ncbi:MAG: CPBP family glutamic-type intramembrane protease [Candidatus Babeliaceae bacterium]
MGNKPIELTAFFFIIRAIEGIVVYGLLLFFGLRFAKKIGIRFLLLDKSANLKNDLFVPGLNIGTLCAFILLFVDKLLPVSSLSLNAFAKGIPPLYGLLGAIFGVIQEEVILCLVCISGFALLFKKIFRHVGMSVIMWISILFVAVLFGICHLPTFIHEISSTTAPLIAQILILNAICSITFGLLFWRKGFETAIFAHFVTNFIICFLFPLSLYLGFF